MIPPRDRPISTHALTWQLASFALLAGLALMTASPLRAQTTPSVDQTPASGAAVREGNVYDHQDHQPTAADVGAAEPSPGSTEAVDRQVQDFLKQMDALDRQAEEQDGGSR